LKKKEKWGPVRKTFITVQKGENFSSVVNQPDQIKGNTSPLGRISTNGGLSIVIEKQNY